MQDRVPKYPGRVKMVPVSGQPNLYDMTMADEPTVAGMPPTRFNLLKDETAKMYEGDPATMVVDDVFQYLAGYRFWRPRLFVPDGVTTTSSPTGLSYYTNQFTVYEDKCTIPTNQGLLVINMATRAESRVNLSQFSYYAVTPSYYYLIYTTGNNITISRWNGVNGSAYTVLTQNPASFTWGTPRSVSSVLGDNNTIYIFCASGNTRSLVKYNASTNQFSLVYTFTTASDLPHACTAIGNGVQIPLPGSGNATWGYYDTQLQQLRNISFDYGDYYSSGREFLGSAVYGGKAVYLFVSGTSVTVLSLDMSAQKYLFAGDITSPFGRFIVMTGRANIFDGAQTGYKIFPVPQGITNYVFGLEG